MPPKGKKGGNTLAQHVKKHPGGVLVMALVVAVTIYFGLFATPQTPEQLNAEKGVAATVEKFDEVSKGVRNEIRAVWGNPASAERKSAMTLWSTMDAFQRGELVKEVDGLLKDGDFKKTAKKLGTTDMSRMFQSVCPDIIGREEFNEVPGTAWALLDAFLAGPTTGEKIMGAEAHEAYQAVVLNGFWSGIDALGFSAADEQRLSAMGWGGIREVLVGLFFKSFGPNLVAKQKRILAGEQNVLPKAPVPWSEEPGAEDVVHMTDESFASAITTKKHGIVMFYAPWCGHCKAFKPAFGEVATLLKDTEAFMGAVDCTVEKALSKQFNVTGYPTLVYFVNGERVSDYDGERNKFGVIEWLNKEARLNGALQELEDANRPPKELTWAEEPEAADVIHMTDDSFDADIKSLPSALVMFYAPWCGHCKHFKPDFAAAATLLKGQVTLGGVDATKETGLAKKFEVKGYPTILYFVNGEKKESYEGARNKEGIVTWLNEASRHNGVLKSEL